MVHPEGMIAIVSAFGLGAYFIRMISQIILKRLDLKRESLGSGGGAIGQRLERIEQAVEAIAIEMERVSEGQRFTTKLLADRASPPQSSSVPAVPPDAR
jgi:hypothetical protein